MIEETLDYLNNIVSLIGFNLSVLLCLFEPLDLTDRFQKADQLSVRLGEILPSLMIQIQSPDTARHILSALRLSRSVS